MNQLRKIDQWIEKIFTNSPNLRAILQLDPTGIGSAYDVMLSHKISEMRSARFRTLMDELSKGDRELTPELVDNEDFLHAFFCAAKAALNSNREEKIRLFGRLLLNAAKTNSLTTDTFEEFVSILDDLSLREFQILLMLQNYEKQTKRREEQNALQFSSSFWDSFEEAIEKELGIKKPEIPSMLTRLSRTGLYESFTGSYLGYEGGKGKTTPLFKKFVQWINGETKTA